MYKGSAKMLKRRILVASVLAVVTIVIGMSPGMVGAAILTNWTGTTGNWADATWDNGNPATGYRAFISNGGTVTINTTGNFVDRFYLGAASDYATVGSGNLVVNSGGALVCQGGAEYVGYKGTASFMLNSGGSVTFNDGSQFQLGAYGGTGVGYQYGGTVNNLDAAGGGVNGDGAFYIGPYGVGTYNLAAGTFNSPWTNVGYGGDPGWGAGPGLGFFVQTGGVHNAPAVTVGGGWDNGGTGTYTISGTGVLNAKDVQLGMMDWGRGAGGAALVGTFNQNSGTVTITHSLILGADVTNGGLNGWGAPGGGGRGVGTYNFNGGTLGQGTGVASLIVRYDAPATGTFQGRGTVGFSGTLTNNGRVIADGGTLDMSSFTAVANSIANTTTNGWFAKNGGELVLPAISVIADGAHIWGADMSLVHSTQLTFHGVVGSGNVSVDLLDAANAGSHNAGTLGTVMGLWDIAPTGFSMSSFDATFRYDDALAGGNESSLKLFEYLGGQWTTIPDTLNIGSHTISAVGLTGGQFAVAIPEPSSLALAAAGLLALAGYGWRRRR
jgi:hypothetical protein